MRPKRLDLIDTIGSDDTNASVLRGIRAGADWSLGLGMKVDVASPEDLTGKAFVFQMRHKATDSTILLMGSTADGRITTGGVTGMLVVFFPRIATKSLDPARNVWALYETKIGRAHV